MKDLSEVLTDLSDLSALSDLSDEGTYKGVTTLVLALAVALRPFWIDRSWANLVGIHHN